MGDNPLLNGLISLSVGIILVVFKRKYDKINEEKEKTKLAQKESQRKIIEKLKEIEFTLENEISADYPKYKKIQNECLIFSNQLTNILSQITGDIPEEVIVSLKELSSDLVKLGNFPIHLDYDLPGDCESIIESTRELVRKIENQH